ncbi:MAG TPA: hypothetical protein DCL76_01315 [Chloroflexi bacterium]|nr:hypothetical protein [Chloroflexota bacterium]HCU98948.1 hypothetical protein [Chloroflexota bacterium]|tara:strand:- start:5814 stop:6164 length:351 start_codon:yes stop_codon:yes gene_type:complete
MKYIKVLLIIVTIFLIVSCGSSVPEPLNMTLRATDIAYDIESINGSVGQTINIQFINDGALEHNFIIDEFGIDNLLQSGESSNISFTLEQAGSYEYYCNVAGHLEAGMKGTILVSE